jgi:DNA-binding protein H-NS
MNPKQLESMSIDDLWEFHQEVTSILEKRIRDKIHRLDNIAEVLEVAPSLQPAEAPKRRPYPKVLPKFQNPERPHETWAGRGKQPLWVTELLEAGKNIEELRIAYAPEAATA